MRRAATLIRRSAFAWIRCRTQIADSCTSYRPALTDELPLFAVRWATGGAAGAYRRGPVSYVSLGLTILTGAGLLYYHNETRHKRIQDIVQSKDDSIGPPALGGPFSLTNQDGRPFTEKDLLGEFALLYFGFTYCPDICPDELDKMAEAMDIVEKQCGAKIQPVFISVDPERDSVEQIKSYVSEFHPRLIGLTGSVEDVKKAAKNYRVYYAKTHGSGDDYLVDHSIIMYLVNPNGGFVTFYGKNFTAERMAKSIVDIVGDWARENPEYSGMREKGKNEENP